MAMLSVPGSFEILCVCSSGIEPVPSRSLNWWKKIRCTPNPLFAVLDALLCCDYKGCKKRDVTCGCDLCKRALSTGKDYIDLVTGTGTALGAAEYGREMLKAKKLASLGNFERW